MPDVKGLLSDPQFQQLDLSTQKSTLGKLDSQFSTISDGDYLKFRDGMKGSLAGPRRPTHSMTGRQIGDVHSTNPQSPNYRTPGQKIGEAVAGTGEIMSPGLIAGGVGGVLEAGSALAAGAARPAIGLIAGGASAYGSYRIASALGAPPWVADLVSSAVGLAVGERVGMSPEMHAKLKSEGFKGIINRWVNGEPQPKQLEAFYHQAHPELKGRALTPQEIETAKVEAADFRKQIAEKIKLAREGPAPYKANPNLIKTKYPGPSPTAEETASAPADTGKMSERYASVKAEGQKPKLEPRTEPYKSKIVKLSKYPGPQGIDAGGSASGSYRNPPSSRYAKLREEMKGTGKLEAAPDAPVKPKAAVAAATASTSTTPPGTEPAGKDAPYGFTHPKESITDLRKQLFSNAQQSDMPNLAVRENFKKLYGHGISGADKDELFEFNEFIAKNKRLPSSKDELK